MFYRRRAQSSLEYALVIAAAAAALICVQVYMKRSIQGRLRESSEMFGEHFEPRLFEYSRIDAISSSTNTTEHYPQEAGGTMTSIKLRESTERYEGDEWGPGGGG